MKKVIALLLAGLWLGGVALAEPAVVCGGAALIDADTGRALWGQNEDKPLPMASTTKIMTALVVLENAADLEAEVTVPKLASGIPGTSIYLTEGETLTVRQLLLGLLLRSGNDAAVALADYTGGSVDRFVAMMNEKARELGVDASFANPHGLDAEGHAASARAMALIAREALAREEFAGIVATQRAVIPWDGNEFSRVLQSKNRLLWEYEGATGVKTGYTGKAGRCLVFSARRDGVSLIGTVLNCGTWFDSAKAILDWGFSSYERRQALARGDPAGEVSVAGTKLPVNAGEDVAVTVGAEDRVEIVVRGSDGLAPPVRAGEVVGRGYVSINGRVEKEFPILAANSIEERGFWPRLRRVLSLWALPARGGSTTAQPSASL